MRHLERDVGTESEGTRTWITVVVHTAGQARLDVYLGVVARVVGNDEQVRGRHVEAGFGDADFLGQLLWKRVADGDVRATQERTVLDEV